MTIIAPHKVYKTSYAYYNASMFGYHEEPTFLIMVAEEGLEPPTQGL